jgi:hypothetical protein
VTLLGEHAESVLLNGQTLPRSFRFQLALQLLG